MQAAETVKSRRDLFAGLIFIAIAILFAWEATNYEMGRAIRMGPGFIPLTLAVLLTLFGALVIFSGLRRHEEVEVTPVPWKGIGLVCLALVIFGEFGAALGLVPVVFIGTAIVAFASERNTALSSLLIAICMSALCWLVFKLGLAITLPTFGPLFSF